MYVVFVMVRIQRVSIWIPLGNIMAYCIFDSWISRFSKKMDIHNEIGLSTNLG